MTQTLPIAILLPHGGLAVPPELTNRVALTPAQIFNEADAYVDEIFDYRDRVLHWLNFPFARGILDVNRPDDAALHHRLGDGAVKGQTSYGVPVFHEGLAPDVDMVNSLIATYWRPWHEKLAAIVDDTAVKLVVDCHSMAAIGPSAYDDPTAVRPRVSVSNLGDPFGEPRENWAHISASPQATRLLGQRLGELLADVPDLAPTGAPHALNQPYLGGWGMRIYGGTYKPWLMIELSRALYIGPQTSDSQIVPPNTVLLNLLRERIWQAIVEVTAVL
ncbi:MAG: N-formylglutamate amidohydrolase [Ardenticatenaceae bacterium]|nr:N-formylglutamate amidohydrolase [Ardenticatenaceae bacterium]MCB8987070.1 N-formylglutamate amidohydrolase [Ardenticatenaceae bacterium]